MTPEGFAAKVDEEWQRLRGGPDTVPVEELDRLKAFFKPHDYETLNDESDFLAVERLKNPAFNAWVRNNVAPHQMPGYAAVTISTKATGIPPGDVTDEQMDHVADWAARFGFEELRISHEQNFVLPDVKQRDLPALFALAQAALLAEANIGLLTDMICCPGGDYCSLANAKSIPIAESIQQRFDDIDYLHDLGPLDLNISGCMNACGHHHVGHIGILGVDKKGDEFYQISIGGSQADTAALGVIIGPSFSRDEVTDVVSRILDVYVDARQDGEEFLACYRRIGIDPFKERVYANAG